MTRNSYSTTNRLKYLITLIVIGLLCFTLFFTAACTQTDTTTTEPTYSYTETDDGAIKNASFAFGTLGATAQSYPKTSVTGWSITKDSSAKSGVVNVTDESWKELLNTLYSDSGILNYVKEKSGLTEDSLIKEKVKEAYELSADPTNDEIKKYFVEKIMLGTSDAPGLFPNPNSLNEGEHKVEDNHVYMLNNYKTGDLGVGSIQKLTSSTEITLDKGECVKISAWVKTINVTDVYNSKTIGANVRVSTSFNGTAQSDYGVFEIENTNGEWKEISFYVTADEVYETKFTLVLGLGYDGKKAEGTVYFDDINIERNATHPTENVVDESIDYADKEKEVKAVKFSDYDATKNYVYNIAVELNKIFTGIVPDYKVSNVEFTSSTSGDIGNLGQDTAPNVAALTADDLNGVPYGFPSGSKFTLDKSSYTITLKKGAESKQQLNSNQYAYIMFFIKSDLSDFYATDITIDVMDINGSTIEKRAAVATFTEANGEWTKCSILIKNNFDINREFELKVIIGPTDVTTRNELSYAKGTVSITDAIVYTDTIYANEDEIDDDATLTTPEQKDAKKEMFRYYQLLSSSTNGSTSLYAGYAADKTEENKDNANYSLEVAPSAIGMITDAPAIPKNYKGIVADHYYIKSDSTTYAINTNSKSGVINTKYNDAYVTRFGINYKHLLGLGTDDEDIQPLTINNETETSYGFIGNSNTISASSQAKISVKVKVTDGAVAYIYLVNTDGADKTVMNFETKEGINLKSVSNKDVVGKDLKLQFKVTNDMLEDNGWLTVEFFVATGASSKSLRLEMWNGSRDGAEKSIGHVFFDDITVTTSNAFTEQKKYQDAFTTSGNPLFNKEFNDDDLIIYEQPLTELEKQYNSEIKSTDNKTVIDYNPTYIWAKNDNTVYAIFNTVDPVEVDPYEAETEEDETETEEDTEADPSTFWLSFSSILLGVALVLAILMLFIKNVRRRRKANASDAKSHYTIVSRTKKKTATKETKLEEVDVDETVEENPEETQEEVVEESEQPADEQSLDSYVYGDVQDFGEEDQPKDE